MKILVDKMQIEKMLSILDSLDNLPITTPIFDIMSPLSQVRARLVFILENACYDTKRGEQ